MGLIAYNKKRAGNSDLKGDKCRKYSISDTAERGFVQGNVCMSVLFANELPNIAACFHVISLVNIDVDFLFWLFLSQQRKNNCFMAVIAELLKGSAWAMSTKYLMHTLKE